MRDIIDYTEKYRDLGFERYQIYYRRKMILEFIEKYSPKRILEIGCGMDPLFQYIDSEYLLFTVVDPSIEFYQNAVNLSKHYNNVGVYNEEFSPREEFISNGYDFIICSSLLHEVENPSKMLSEIADICARRTVVHINVPNAFSLHRLIAYGASMINDVHDFSRRNVSFQQNTVFDLNALMDLARSCGFNIIESGSYFLKPFTHNQMQQAVDNGILDDQVMDGLYETGKILQGYGSEIYLNLRLKNGMLN